MKLAAIILPLGGSDGGKRGKMGGDEWRRGALSKLESQLGSSLIFCFFPCAWEAVWIESNNPDWLSVDEWLSNDTGLSFGLIPSLCTYLSWLLRSRCGGDRVSCLPGGNVRPSTTRRQHSLGSLKVPFESFLWLEVEHNERVWENR